MLYVLRKEGEREHDSNKDSVDTSISPGEWDVQNSLEFWDTNRSPNLGQWYLTKKGTCRIVDFAVPAEYKVKIKVSEKIDRYLG